MTGNCQPTGDASKVYHERYHSGIEDASGRELQLIRTNMDPARRPRFSLSATSESGSCKAQTNAWLLAISSLSTPTERAPWTAMADRGETRSRLRLL